MLTGVDVTLTVIQPATSKYSSVRNEYFTNNRYIKSQVVTARIFIKHCNLPVLLVKIILKSNYYTSLDWTKLWFKLLEQQDPSKRAPVPVMIQRLFVSVIRELNSDCIVCILVSKLRKTLDLWRPSIFSIDPMLYITQGHSSYFQDTWHVITFDSLKY